MVFLLQALIIIFPRLDFASITLFAEWIVQIAAIHANPIVVGGFLAALVRKWALYLIGPLHDLISTEFQIIILLIFCINFILWKNVITKKTDF